MLEWQTEFDFAEAGFDTSKEPWGNRAYFEILLDFGVTAKSDVTVDVVGALGKSDVTVDVFGALGREFSSSTPPINISR